MATILTVTCKSRRRDLYRPQLGPSERQKRYRITLCGVEEAESASRPADTKRGLLIGAGARRWV